MRCTLRPGAEMSEKDTYRGTVFAVSQEAPYLRIQIGDINPSWKGHEPGQFANWRLDDGGPKAYRPFTMVRFDQSEGTLEFWADTSYQGRATQYLCQLEPGSQVEFLGPVGSYKLLEDQRTAPAVFIGNSVGLAPLVGMAAAAWHEGANRLTVIHEPAGDGAFPASWVAEVLQPQEGIDIRLGVVGSALSALDSIELPHGACAYLCGGGDLITKAQERLKERGVPESHIVTEKFW